MKTQEELKEKLRTKRWELGQMKCKLKKEAALSASLWDAIKVRLSDEARYKVANMLAHSCLVHAITDSWGIVLTRSDYEKDGNYLVYFNNGDCEWVTHEDYKEWK